VFGAAHYQLGCRQDFGTYIHHCLNCVPTHGALFRGEGIDMTSQPLAVVVLATRLFLSMVALSLVMCDSGEMKPASKQIPASHSVRPV
jgi:hypothetical protein